MSDLGRVVVAAGGLSPERDVSLRSGRRVAEQLRSAGVQTEELDADAGLVAALAADPPAAVFPVVHGRSGEDGSLAEVFELLGLPYVGSRPGPSRLAWDKPGLAAAGGPAHGGRVAGRRARGHRDARAVVPRPGRRPGARCGGRPARAAPGGEARPCGLRAGQHRRPGPRRVARGHGRLLRLRDGGADGTFRGRHRGRGRRPGHRRRAAGLPVVEIVPDGGRYDYDARYNAGVTEFFVPARLPRAVADRCAAIAVAVHQAFGLRDLSRTDLIVDGAGEPWFLEVNVSPGLTETSLVPQALVTAGVDVGATYRELVAGAVARLAREPA